MSADPDTGGMGSPAAQAGSGDETVAELAVPGGDEHTGTQGRDTKGFCRAQLGAV